MSDARAVQYSREGNLCALARVIMNSSYYSPNVSDHASPGSGICP